MSAKLLCVICIALLTHDGSASMGINGDDDHTERLREATEAADRDGPYDEQISPKSRAAENVKGMGGIVGGTTAKEGEYPWQVILAKKNWNGMQYFCGGTIIDDHHIITAAHCIDYSEHNDKPMIHYPGLYTAVVGNYRNSRYDRREQRLRIAHSIIHTNYQRYPYDGSGDNDIAIIRTVDKIVFNKFVQPAILPWNAAQNTNLYKPGTEALISGWGSAKRRRPFTEPSDPGTDILKGAEVIVRDIYACDKAYIAYGIIYSCKKGSNHRICRYMNVHGIEAAVRERIRTEGHELTENMLCAGYFDGSIDTCQGDSGGPLVVKDDKGRPILTGVVSFGAGCAWPGLPGIYAKVSNYQSWVEYYLNSS